MFPLNNELESCRYQKLTEHKNYLTLEIWEEAHLLEIFYSTLICSMICIGRQCWRAYSCPPTWWPKLLFAYILLNV